jgi:hypothetical protein
MTVIPDNNRQKSNQGISSLLAFVKWSLNMALVWMLGITKISH